MWKLILVGATALVIAGSSPVSAQQRPGGPERPRWQLSQQDMAAFAEARIAGLKAGLVLTPEQEKNWPAFEAAMRELARHRIERRSAREGREQAQDRDPTERLRRYAEALSGYGAVIKKLADAQEPLYNSLDEAQKRRFAVLARPTRQGSRWRHRHRPGHSLGRHPHDRDGHSDRRDRRGAAGEGARL